MWTVPCFDRSRSVLVALNAARASHLCQASLRWPPEYPPESLSKLIKGHEAFAPRELVLEQRDLLRTIAPNVDGLLNASEAYVANEMARRQLF